MNNVTTSPQHLTQDPNGSRTDFIPKSPPPVPPGQYLHFDERGNLQSMDNFDGNGKHAQQTIGSDGSRYFVASTNHDTQFYLISARDPLTGERSHYDFTMDGSDPEKAAVAPPNPEAGSPTIFSYYDNGKVKDIFVPQPPPSIAPGKYVQLDNHDGLEGVDLFDGNGRHVLQETFATDGTTYAVINDDKGTTFHLSWPKVDPHSPGAKGIEVDLDSGRGVMDFTLPGVSTVDSGSHASDTR